MSAPTALTTALAPGFDPLDHIPERDAIVWASGDKALVAWGRTACIAPGAGDLRFERAALQLRSVFASMQVDDRVRGWGTGPLAFGAFSFDPDSPDSCVVVPSLVLGRAGDRAWITTIGGAAPSDPVARARTLDPSVVNGRPHRAWDGATNAPLARRNGSSMDDVAWRDAAIVARAAVRDGLIEKVVLARDAFVSADAPFDQRTIVARLAACHPRCFTFAIDGMVGATPELLVRRTGDRVLSVVLAGSSPRGETEAEDARLGAQLLSSSKDAREHALAVATVQQGLERACDRISVDAHPSLLELSYVKHLCTVVRADLRAPRSALELAGALHPTAAVCGVPSDKALAAIRELESFDRARYCGPVGWVGAHGDGEWAIALRCAQLCGRQARLFAGAGIVGDSDPEAELREIELKLRPLLDALGPAR